MAANRERVHRALLRLGPFHPRLVAASLGWAVRRVMDVARRRAEPRLTVGVDVASLWEPLTGVGWYVYQLLAHLAERDDVRLRLYGRTVVPTEDVGEPVVEIPEGPALERVLYRVPEELRFLRGPVARVLRRLEPLLIALDDNDVLFAPNYFLPRRFSLCRGALVATVLDLTIRVAPWTMRDETVRELGEHLESTVFRADRLLTISETVRGEMLARGYGSPQRLHAIHLGPGQLATVAPGEPPAGVAERYALFVGTVEPRKNLGVLLDAWELLAAELDDPPQLVVCGRLGWKSEGLAERLRALEPGGLVRHLGYVPEGELAALYRECLFVAFPSLYEGFGLPAVEAMRVGAPVLASDIPVLREVAADAALFAPAGSPEAWAAGARRLATDSELRADLRARGKERLEAFDWERTATETLAVLRLAAGAGR